MRATGFALLGFLGGAAAGFVFAVLFVALWYDVLGIGDHGGDGMSGLANFLVLAPTLSLLGGCVGAAWLGRRAAGRAPGGTIAAVVAILLALFALFAVVGVAW